MLIISTSEYFGRIVSFDGNLKIRLKCMGLKSEANHLRENYWKLEKLLESEVNFKISVLSFCCA